MISLEIVRHSGALVVSAFVRGDGMEWLESRTFYGYGKVEAKQLFREWVSSNGYKITNGGN
jgi:hypothetical protein